MKGRRAVVYLRRQPYTFCLQRRLNTCGPSEGSLSLATCLPVQVGSRVSSMEWGPNPRLMSVVTADGISACRKTLLRHRFRDGYVVIQSGVDQLMVELMDGLGRPPAKLRAKVQMLGLDISKGTLLVYDGTRADLYKVRAVLSSGSKGEVTVTQSAQCMMGAWGGASCTR